MIYLDTSVALAHLLSEDRVPPSELWEDSLVSSRLLEYELWVRLNGRGLSRSHGEAARQLLSRVAFLELVPAVLGRMHEPFPARVRTLDALHLASLHFLRTNGQDPKLATYDDRLRASARSMRMPLFELG